MRNWHRAATAVAAVTIAGLTTGPVFAADTSVSVVSAQDKAYLKASHQSNLAEIAAGKDAKKNATTSCVKKVAKTLVRDHQRLDAQGKTLAKQVGVTLPTKPNAKQQQALAALKPKAKTAAYDKAWLKTQEKAHKAALSVVGKEIRGGKDKQVIASARAAKPILEKHLKMVQGGTCHAGTATTGPSHVPAGGGGQAAGNSDTESNTGAAVLGGGVIALAAGTGWVIHARRTRSDR